MNHPVFEILEIFVALAGYLDCFNTQFLKSFLYEENALEYQAKITLFGRLLRHLALSFDF